MNDFSINEMQEMQKLLQEKYKDKWEQITPEVGKNNRGREINRYINILLNKL